MAEIKRTFEETRVCYECGEPVEERSIGTEGWTICGNCGIVEGRTETKYYCSHCEELKNTKECDCVPR